MGSFNLRDDDAGWNILHKVHRVPIDIGFRGKLCFGATLLSERAKLFYIHSSVAMVSLRGLSALLGLAASLVSVLGQDTVTDWPIHNNGLNKVVEWYVRRTLTITLPLFPLRPCHLDVCIKLMRRRDHHSFMIKGERLFVFSGEV